VEVYQALRESFEYPGCHLQYPRCVADSTNGWVNIALALGMRLGLLASSDHNIGACFTGVYASSLDRDAIWGALQERRCFGTSRATKMDVDFRVAGALMGSEVEAPAHPLIQITIHGTLPLSAIEINKDGNPAWFSASCSAADTTFTIRDPDPAIEGTSSYYYLRVMDAADRAIWTSPVWVDFVTDSSGVHDASGSLSLRANPNPFVGWVDLAVSGLGSSGGRLRIHDASGRLVRDWTFVAASSQDAFRWDGRDSSGNEVSAGMYYAVVQSHGATRSAKIVLLR
jgi:hypothetical protein